MKSIPDGKRLSTKSTPHLYLKVKFTREDDKVELTPTQYKFQIMQAVKETLGVVGASYPLDVLRVWPGGYAILRIPNMMKEKIWAALTLYGNTESGVKCSFHVLQTSPYLMALAFDSRDAPDQVFNIH